MNNVAVSKIIIFYLFILLLGSCSKKSSTSPEILPLKNITVLQPDDREDTGDEIPNIIGYTFSDKESCQTCQVRFRENLQGDLLADMIHWGEAGQIQGYKLPVAFNHAQKTMSIEFRHDNQESNSKIPTGTCHFSWKKKNGMFNFSLQSCTSDKFIKSLEFAHENQVYPGGELASELVGTWINTETKSAFEIFIDQNFSRIREVDQDDHNLFLQDYNGLHTNIYKYRNKLADGVRTEAKLLSSKVNLISLKVTFVFSDLIPTSRHNCDYYALDEKTLVAQNYNPNPCPKTLRLDEGSESTKRISIRTLHLYEVGDRLKLSGYTFQVQNSTCTGCQIQFRLSNGKLVADFINWGTPGVIYALSVPVAVETSINSIHIDYINGGCYYDYTPVKNISSLKFIKINCKKGSKDIPADVIHGAFPSPKS